MTECIVMFPWGSWGNIFMVTTCFVLCAWMTWTSHRMVQKCNDVSNKAAKFGKWMDEFKDEREGTKK